jgi:phenylalanyl-tRNA synthetase beta chain
VGRVFQVTGDPSSPLAEPLHLAAVLSGPATDGAWRPSRRTVDFFDTKALVEDIAREVGLSDLVTYQPLPTVGLPGLVPADLLHPGKAAQILVGGQVAGALGELHPALLASTGLRIAPQILVLLVSAWSSRLGQPTRVTPISEFPGVTRDLALLVPTTVSADEVMATIRRKGRPLLEGVRLFDVYEGKGVPDGHRSLGYTLHFVAPDRTLRDEEVQQATDAILAELAKKGVVLRGATVSS